MKGLKFLFAVSSVLLLVGSYSCDSASNPSPSASAGGKGGSMARFAVSGNAMYILSGDSMRVFDVSDNGKITPMTSIIAGNDVETIYPRGNALFLGTETGMNIFDITTPSMPVHLSTFSHIRSCDPVAADDKYAYVTLRGGSSRCSRGSNELNVIDVTDLRAPFLVKSYPMREPYGLGISDSNLFVCDSGLKVFRVKGAGQLEMKHHFHEGGYDVIPQGNLLISIGRDGLYQYQFGPGEMKLLSKLTVTHRF
jgi:hypothetical protein